VCFGFRTKNVNRMLCEPCVLRQPLVGMLGSGVYWLAAAGPATDVLVLFSHYIWSHVCGGGGGTLTAVLQCHNSSSGGGGGGGGSSSSSRRSGGDGGSGSGSRSSTAAAKWLD